MLRRGMTTASAEPQSGLNSSEIKQFTAITALAVVSVLLAVLGVAPVVVFIVAGLAVAGMAHVLGVATEHAGDAAGPRLSALLNATFGNAAEIFIVVLAIREGGELIDVARASIVGSVLGNLLLILGASLLVAGLRHGRQAFNARVAGVNATMLILGAAALALPTLFSYSTEASEGDLANLSHGVAIVMALLYAGYLIHAFQEPEEATGHGPGHSRWSVRLALIVLAASAIATGVLSEVLVGAIEPTIEDTGISPVFIGLIIVPLVGNVAEHFAAVKIAWNGNIDFAAGIALNSALQVALAVSAIAVGAGVIFGNEVTLLFPSLEIAVLIAATLLATIVAVNANANWLEGVELLAIYVIAAMAFWYL
jgi:Ca2+:H+ antiporter